MKKIFIIMVLFYAVSVYAAPGWSSFEQVTSIQAGDDAGGAIYIITSGTMVNDGCTPPGWYVLLSSHPSYNEIYSLVLQARSTGKTIKFYINSCGGTLNYPKIQHAQVNY